MHTATVGKVALLEWPDDEARRVALRQAQEPCLLIVRDGSAPPTDIGVLEDWARHSANASEVLARLTALADRAARTGRGSPTVDADGILHWGGQSVVLSPINACLARVLCERFESLVGRDALWAAGWSNGTVGRALELQLLRLRRRLAPLGLAIDNVRGQGYLLKVAPAHL
jgi:DNA-binding response OmpR family regulator